jgi:hypothetical protein
VGSADSDDQVDSKCVNRQISRRSLLTEAAGLAVAAAVAPSGARAEVLFDGQTFRNFRTPTGTTGPEVSWRIRDGSLVSIPDARRQCDLWTAREYADFDLEFEWKLGPKGNSGIKYLIQKSAVDHLHDAQGEFLHETSLGFEFQLADDGGAAGPLSNHISGALYNYLAPEARTAHPAGEWNTGRLVVNGEQVEHWINQRRVLAFGLHSPELRQALAVRQVPSARMLERLELRRTPIAFQHHESAVAFRGIRVKEL